MLLHSRSTVRRGTADRARPWDCRKIVGVAGKSNRGFTLLQMVLAMTILALIAGAFIPLLARKTQQNKREVEARTLNRFSADLVNDIGVNGVIPGCASWLNSISSNSSAKIGRAHV